jgi:hypothetical protein
MTSELGLERSAGGSSAARPVSRSSPHPIEELLVERIVILDEKNGSFESRL